MRYRYDSLRTGRGGEDDASTCEGTYLSADDPEKGGNTVGILVSGGFLEEGLHFVAGLG